jgi:hypothetical protein
VDIGTEVSEVNEVAEWWRMIPQAAAKSFKALAIHLFL